MDKQRCVDCNWFLDLRDKEDQLPTSNRESLPLRLGVCAKEARFLRQPYNISRWNDDIACKKFEEICYDLG